MNKRITPITRQEGLQGRIKIPGDKSISHRALILGALAHGKTQIKNLLRSDDVASTQKVLESLGCEFRPSADGNELHIEGRGRFPFQSPSHALDCGNSGTTIRLMMGVLAGQSFPAVLTGDESLQQRPMKRIADPLREMGAQIQLREDRMAPVHISGSRNLRPLQYCLPLASAQLKSALLLAGIFAEGTTRLTGLIQSRDHTERMFPHFGIPLSINSEAIELNGGEALKIQGTSVTVPGDFSSAAFWIAAALLVPGSDLVLENVSLNPTRTGLLDILTRMGVQIESEVTIKSPEPLGTIRIRHQEMKGVTIEPTSEENKIPFLIDELPLIAVLATQAEGITTVRGAEELRVKETDRIEAIAKNLRAMGAEIETFSDGFRIHGKQNLQGSSHHNSIHSMQDHRIAMAFSVAGLIAKGETRIEGAECVGISYPDFYETLHRLSGLCLS